MHSIVASVYANNLLAGWWGFLGGAASGALLGLGFHREGWMGGYDSFARRMLRLGHIACFGIGLINILFALSAGEVSPAADVASSALVVALIAMPSLCFLTAWKAAFHRWFFVPVLALSTGIVGTLIHLS